MNKEILYILKQTTQYFRRQQKQAYLVGGSLRNLLLHVPSLDWDILTTGDIPKVARQLADKLGGHYVHMHDKASRVVVNGTIFDISPLKGNTLEDDLRARDFTINAMAASLDDVVHYLESGDIEQGHDGRPRGPHHPPDGVQSPRQGSTRVPTPLHPSPAPTTSPPPLRVIDPLHGLADIKARRLRAVDDEVFRHDSLRMLRAVRLRARYQLSIDPSTEALIARDAALLPSVAAERIHDELYAILEPNGAVEQLHLLDTLGLLSVLIPEFIPARGMPQPRPHYWDVLEHSIETVGALERLAGMLQGWELTFAGDQFNLPEPTEDLGEIRTLLQEAEQQGIFQFSTLTAPPMKLAALLHDIGKPATYTVDEDGSIHFYGHPQVGAPLAQQIMKRLNASMQDRRLVQVVTNHHMRPGSLGQSGEPVTMRAIRRYFVDLGPTGILVALLSLADHMATYGPQPSHSWGQHLAVVRLLLTRYIRERESILPPRLISAEELMRRLNLEPGPIIGQLLERIAEAQAEGQIHSKEEALWLAEEYRQK